ncbi:MAG: beta-ketoacyl-[acyl-carrier-protein] synthase family protein, partial [Armatimonadota bacterium]
KRGDADAMITGGSEAAVTTLAVAGFCAAGAMSRHNDDPAKASRPFDANRDGFVIAEGGGALVIEELEGAKARGAPIFAEIVGYGMSGDAYHVTAPATEGAIRAMREALRRADMASDDIDYVNAHAPGTPAGDASEAEALKQVFGDRAREIPVSSTKSMIGHMLGGAGAAELIATILAIQRGVIPPTINYETPDPACDLDVVPNEARPAKVVAALSNSFGFGGQNATIVVREYEP